MSFPNKEDRVNCWGHRDEYWKCLDKGKSDSDCKEFRKQYEKFCPAQWVKHFDRKREYLKFKEQIENEGGSRGADVSNAYTNRSEVAVRTTPQGRPFPIRGRNYD